MQTWTYDDRSFGDLPLPEGPWTDEPDKAQWIDEATGLDCLIVRNGMGTLCGYVGVDEDHPFFGVGYSQCMQGCEEKPYTAPGDGSLDGYPGASEAMAGLAALMGDRTYTDCWDHSPEAAVSVHGGLTYSGFCQERDNPGEGICHVPADGRPAKVWWLGFDCGHYRDLTPQLLALSMQRNFEYPFTDPREQGNVYRDLEYVKAEVTSLAAQLKEISDGTGTRAPVE